MSKSPQEGYFHLSKGIHMSSIDAENIREREREKGRRRERERDV